MPTVNHFDEGDFSIYSTIRPEYYFLDGNGTIDIGLQSERDGAKISLSGAGMMRLVTKWLEQLDRINSDDREKIQAILDKK